MYLKKHQIITANLLSLLFGTLMLVAVALFYLFMIEKNGNAAATSIFMALIFMVCCLKSDKRRIKMKK